VAREVPADLEATVYADADAADDVAELRVGGASWLALTQDQKDQAAATATRDIDSIGDSFVGVIADDDQLLEWPRTGTDYSSDAWPQRLVDAAIELMFSYVPAFATGASIDVLNPDPNASNIKREKIGPIETEYFAARTVEATALERFPAVVQRLLAGLVRTSNTSAWGSASVSRAS
jgi:hypothetical protein